jgi:hypothetical protein
MPSRCEMAHKGDHAHDSFLANFLKLKKGFEVVSWELLGLGALVGFSPAFSSRCFRPCRTLTCCNRQYGRTTKGDYRTR